MQPNTNAESSLLRQRLRRPDRAWRIEQNAKDKGNQCRQPGDSDSKQNMEKYFMIYLPNK
jgi:hypothetical protein